MLFLGLSSAIAATPPPSNVTAVPRPAPIELVKKHVDIEVNADGSFLQADEVAMKALTEQGAQALRQTTFSYTEGYQSVEVKAAYTLKADGTKIEVPDSEILRGHGATTAPGFQDVKTMTIVFPNLAVGDQVVLMTLLRQQIPWFKGQFAAAFPLSRVVVAHDVSVEITAPADYPLAIDAAGLDGGAKQNIGGKNFWRWQFNNDIAAPSEPGAVSDFDDGPHLIVSSLPDVATTARLYADLFKGRAAVTPEIQAQADRLTAGIVDRREQARALFDWVAKNISYVAIVLGAGGLTPHFAADVLKDRYGDCKDHVMLLDALLAAKGIAASPVLIDSGNSYRTPAVASPFLYDHLITYVPEFRLYLDSTVPFAAFGVLPPNEYGKPVVVVSSGELTRIPNAKASDATLKSVEQLKVAKDGSITGDTNVIATGSTALLMRALMTAIPPDKDGDYFKAVLGPQADGTFDRGDLTSLSQSYSFSAHYNEANAVTFPGPAALWPGMAFKPFSFLSLVAQSLPPARTRDYVCDSITADEDLTIDLPAGVALTSLPKPFNIRAGGMILQGSFTQRGADTIHETTRLEIAHPDPVCTPAYYRSVRDDLAKMLAALRAQVIYK